MAFQPSHPAERSLHHDLRDALNQQLSSTDYFVWIDVTPTGHSGEFDDVAKIASETETWLQQLDPDKTDPTNMPKLEFSDPAADVEIRAIPKKREARGLRAEQIVGNPEPAVAGWI